MRSLILAALVFMGGATALAEEFYVAPGGNDANPGTEQKPFATIPRAQHAVREVIAGGKARNVTVWLEGGVYPIHEPLVFKPEDNSQDVTVTYVARPGTHPVISGGVEIRNWQRQKDGSLLAKVPDSLRQVGVRDLYIQGRRATRARHPNSGYFRIKQAGPDNRTSFTYAAGDVEPWKDQQQVEVVFLHDWSTSRIPVREIQPDQGRLVVAFPIGANAPHYAISHFEPHPRYFLENSRAFLDVPGEWHYDAEQGAVRYLPRDNESAASLIAVAPLAEQLLVVAGGPGPNQAVRNLHFEGLTFAHSRWDLPAQGFAGSQAGAFELRGEKRGRTSIPWALEFQKAEGCRLSHCRIMQLGESGVLFGSRCRNCALLESVLTDIAGNGIGVGEMRTPPREEVASGTQIENNQIERCGAKFYGCVGIWVGMAEKTSIRHNELAQLPYTGISLGWRWNPQPSPCREHLVESNHLHDVMQVLSDGGGIYTLGRQPGTVLRKNLIHDVPLNAGRAESNGMFLDEGTTEILIEENVIGRIARSPLRFHRADQNEVRRNQLYVTPGTPMVRYNSTPERNIHLVDNQVETLPYLRTVEGVQRRALACNSQTIMEVPTAERLEPAELTLACWLRVDQLPTTGPQQDTRRWVVSKNANEWTEGHYGLVIDGQGRLGAYLNIGNGRDNAVGLWSAVATIKPGRWQHLALSYDGKTLGLYLNAEKVGEQEVGRKRTPGHGPLVIGRRPDGYVAMEGLVDEVALCDRVLGQGDLKALMSNKEPPGLIQQWSFDQSSKGLELPGAGITPEAVTRMQGLGLLPRQ